MSRRLLLLFAAAALLRPAAAWGWSSGGAFLPLGHGARAHALGGTGIALIRDDAAAYWNPANLCWMDRQAGLTLMAAEVFPGVSDGYQTLSYGRRAGLRLGGEDQTMRPARWGYGLFYSHFGLDFDAGAWAENTIQLAGSWAFANYASVGLAGKILWLTNGFESGGAWGGGLDVAASAILFDSWYGSVVIRDAITSISYDTGTTETQEPQIGLGLEFRKWKPFSATSDVVLRHGETLRASLGVEWRAVRDVLTLRGGWSVLPAGESRGYPSAGAGFRWQRFELDYGASFDADDALGTKQRLSLHVRL